MISEHALVSPLRAFREVFASGLRLPPRVAIVAPGPGGRGRYGEIPADFFVLAVSKAVLIPELPRVDLWLMNHVHQDWYPEASRRFQGIRVYGYEAALAADPELAGRDRCYYFVPPEELLDDARVLLPVEGCVRYGGSVTGCAVQLAFNLGASDLLLCGADMSGDGYFDGTANVQPTHGEVWPAARRLDLVIRWLREERGVRVSTLSHTRLNVPWYEREVL